MWPVSGSRRFLPLLGWVAAVVAALGVLVLTGRGTLAGPPVLDPGSWAGWVAGRSPAVAAAAVLRLVALALAAWLLVGTAVVAALAVARDGMLPDVADLLTTPAIRRAVHAAVGAGISGASVAAVAAGTAVSPLAQVPHVAAAPPSQPVTTVTTVTTATTSTSISPTTTTTTLPLLRVAAPPEPGSPAATTPAPATWTVQPGDHLWNIAERTAPADVATYWRRLVELNRPRLADPDNPDLLFPGDVVVLPQ
jgi:nucleoid-associated protein YgaU